MLSDGTQKCRSSNRSQGRHGCLLVPTQAREAHEQEVVVQMSTPETLRVSRTTVTSHRSANSRWIGEPEAPAQLSYEIRSV